MARGLEGPVNIIPGNTHNLLASQAISGAGATNSTILEILDLRSYFLQFIWTGTLTGTIAINGSASVRVNGDGTFNTTGTVWSSLGITVTGPAGSAGSAIVDTVATAAPFLQVTYTNASGSGTMIVIAHAKAT